MNLHTVRPYIHHTSLCMNGIVSIISNLFPFVLSLSKDSERRESFSATCQWTVTLKWLLPSWFSSASLRADCLTRNGFSLIRSLLRQAQDAYRTVQIARCELSVI